MLRFACLDCRLLSIPQEIESRIRHLGYRRLNDWLKDNDLEGSVENGKMGLVAMRILMGNENPELQ